MPSPNNVQQVNVGGSVGTGAQTSDSPVFIAGWDATLLRAILTDTSGRIQIAGGVSVGNPSTVNPLIVGGVDSAGNVRQLLVNSQQQLYVNTEGLKTTYRASTGFNANTTGILWSIKGSNTKTVRITRILMSMTGAAASNPVLIIFYNGAMTGGTPVTVTSLPLDSTFAAGTALVQTWGGGNPTNANAVAHLLDHNYPVLTNGQMMQEFTFSDKNGAALVLRGVTQMIALTTGTGATIGYNLIVEWTEE